MFVTFSATEKTSWVTRYHVRGHVVKVIFSIPYTTVAIFYTTGSDVLEKFRFCRFPWIFLFGKLRCDRRYRKTGLSDFINYKLCFLGDTLLFSLIFVRKICHWTLKCFGAIYLSGRLNKLIVFVTMAGKQPYVYRGCATVRVHPKKHFTVIICYSFIVTI
jgi:hypothetical protein